MSRQPKESPNWMKFASQVKQLDIHCVHFAEQVADLEARRRRREKLIEDVNNVFQQSIPSLQDTLPVNALDPTVKGSVGALLEAISVAVERFVVDNHFD